MITQVEVFTPRVTTSPLPVTDGTAATDPIQIRNIDGLGPVNATVNTSQYAAIDGGYYNGSTIGDRNIVLTVGLNPNWVTQTMEGLRAILYQYFMPKQQVTLRVSSTHMETVEIVGYVESFTPNIFSKDPEIQISIICPKPAFVAITATVVPGVTGALPDDVMTTIDYQGTMPTGFVLTATDDASLTAQNGELRFMNNSPDEKIFILAVAQLSTSTYLQISTVEGDKFARQMSLPGDAPTNILDQVEDGSVWMQLNQGDNQFRVSASQPGHPWSLQYYAKYGGI